MPPFTSRYTVLDLLGLVRRVVDAQDYPQETTQATFDAARPSLGAGVPTARAICQRAGVGWPSLVRFVLDEQDGLPALAAAEIQERLDDEGSVIGEDSPDWLTVDHATNSLRLCALRTGVKVASREQFRVWRDGVLVADRRRHRHGGIVTIVSARQLELRWGGDWDAVIKTLRPDLPIGS